MPKGRGGFLHQRGRGVRKGSRNLRSYMASRQGSAILKRINANRKAPGKGRRRLKYSGPGAGRIAVGSYTRDGRRVQHHWRAGNARRGGRPNVIVPTTSEHEKLGRHIYRNLRRKDAGRPRKHKPIDHGFD